LTQQAPPLQAVAGQQGSPGSPQCVHAPAPPPAHASPPAHAWPGQHASPALHDLPQHAVPRTPQLGASALQPAANTTAATTMLCAMERIPPSQCIDLG